jgi:hypothetical protein
MSTTTDAPTTTNKGLSLADILGKGNDDDGFEIVEMAEGAESNDDEEASAPKAGYCVECEGNSSPRSSWILLSIMTIRSAF